MSHGDDRQRVFSSAVLKSGKSSQQTTATSIKSPPLSLSTSTTNSPTGGASATPLKSSTTTLTTTTTSPPHRQSKIFSNETTRKQESNKTNYKSLDALDSASLPATAETGTARRGNKNESIGNSTTTTTTTTVTISLLPSSLPPTSPQIRLNDNKLLLPNIKSANTTSPSGKTMTSSQPTTTALMIGGAGLTSDLTKSSSTSNYEMGGKTVLDVSKLRKSFSFNLNHALDYTCNNLALDSTANQYCGKCNSCQIITYLNNLKQWFDRASHITLKKFLLGLINRINNLRLLNYLNDLLSPLTECKDFVYARNKYLPSCEEDHSKPTNNRCLDEAYVSKQIEQIWQWYSKANYFIKLNFILSVLNKCEQAIVFLVIIKIKSILDAYAASTLTSRQKGNADMRGLMRKDANAPKFTYFDTARKMAAATKSAEGLENFLGDTDDSDEEELVFDAFDAEEDDEDELDLLNNEDYEEYEKDYLNSNGLSALNSSRKSHLSSTKTGNASKSRKKQQKSVQISRENLKSVDFIK